MIQNLSVLPLRQNIKKDGSISKLQRRYYSTVFWEIELKATKIYQYSYKLQQNIELDSKIYRVALQKNQTQIQNLLGEFTCKGQILYGTKNQNLQVAVRCIFNYNQQHFDLNLILNKVKQIDMRDVNDPDTRKIVFQLLNINLRQKLRKQNYKQLVKKPGSFFKKEKSYISQMQNSDLDVHQGFKATLDYRGGKISLLIDVCYRIIQSKFVSQIIEQNHCYDQLIDETVVADYGNNKTYKIVKIDPHVTAESTFEKDGKMITYGEYFAEQYGKKVRNYRMPMIQTYFINKRYEKKQLIQQKVKAYLHPEFVRITGIPSKYLSNFKIMTQIAGVVRKYPTQKMELAIKLKNTINKVGCMFEVTRNLQVGGYCLPYPKIIAANKRQLKIEKGRFQLRNCQVKQAHKFLKQEWVLVHSDDSTKNADEFLGLLKKAAPAFGICIQDPIFFAIKKSHNIGNWIDIIREDFTSYGKSKMYVFLVGKKQQKHYEGIKEFMSNKVQAPCQFVTQKKLFGKKGSSLSVVSNILKQMNVKVGKTLWIVRPSHNYFSQRKVMYAGLCVSKGVGGYILAFVGSIKDDFSMIYNYNEKIQTSNSIAPKFLEHIFTEWAKAYYKQQQSDGEDKSRRLPDTIILYRQGLNDQQIKNRVQHEEVPAMNQMIKSMGKGAKLNDYCPQFVIVGVNRKVTGKFISTDKKGQFHNPEPGSVVMEDLETEGQCSFHIVPQDVNQGMATPTRCVIAINKSEMPFQALVSFTHEQCYNYPNWQGAIRVPSCLQSANKLAKLVSQGTKKIIVPGKQMSRVQYYL